MMRPAKNKEVLKLFQILKTQSVRTFRARIKETLWAPAQLPPVWIMLQASLRVCFSRILSLDSLARKWERYLAVRMNSTYVVTSLYPPAVHTNRTYVATSLFSQSPHVTWRKPVENYINTHAWIHMNSHAAFHTNWQAYCTWIHMVPSRNVAVPSCSRPTPCDGSWHIPICWSRCEMFSNVSLSLNVAL